MASLLLWLRRVPETIVFTTALSCTFPEIKMGISSNARWTILWDMLSNLSCSCFSQVLYNRWWPHTKTCQCLAHLLIAWRSGIPTRGSLHGNCMPIVLSMPVSLLHEAVNNYPLINPDGFICTAVLFQSYLATYCEGMVLVWAVATRCQVEPVMLNPLFKSQSPLDFWSKRWNLLVHRVLKGGVYKPVRKHSSAIMAILASFIASGLFHEWLLYL